MNCKPGDMALIFRSECVPDNLGKVVTCMRLATSADCCGWVIGATGDIWVIDRPIVWKNGFGHTVALTLCPDDCLRPIKPERDEDLEYTEWLAAEIANGNIGMPVTLRHYTISADEA